MFSRTLFLVALLHMGSPATGFDWPSSLSRRDSAKVYDIPFFLTHAPYASWTINCTIGTPPQEIAMIIDTSEGDNWIHDLTTDEDPYFNKNLSSTYKGDILTVYYNDSDSYFNGNGYNPLNFTALNVTYSSDTFSFGSTILPQMAFESSETLCLADVELCGVPVYENAYYLAMGVSSNQAALWNNSDATGAQYPTLMQQMKSMNIIATRAYSIWVDDPMLQTGHVLLGGINSKRYQGNLTVLDSPYTSSVVIETPYSALQRQMSELKISVVSFGVSNGASSQTEAIPPVPILPLPYWVSTVSPAAAKFVWDAVGATYDTTLPLANLSSQTPTVPCSYLSNSSTLDLKFGGAPNLTVSVPMSDLTIHNGTGPNYDQGLYGSNCQFLLWAWADESTTAVLGPAVMKHMYTVFDFENNIISIALSKFGSTEDNIIEIPPGGVAAIPASAFGTQASTTNSTSSPKKHNNAAAIGAGVAIPLVFLICVLFGFFFGRRKKSSQTPEIQPETHQWHQAASAIDPRKSELPAHPERAFYPDPTYEADSTPTNVDKAVHENMYELPSPHQNRLAEMI